VIIAISLFSYKQFAAKTVVDPGIYTRTEPRFLESKINVSLIEPFCTTIRRTQWIFVPMSAIVRLGIFISRQGIKKHCWVDSKGLKGIETEIPYHPLKFESLPDESSFVTATSCRSLLSISFKSNQNVEMFRSSSF
jgi:hypothetical protein